MYPSDLHLVFRLWKGKLETENTIIFLIVFTTNADKESTTTLSMMMLLPHILGNGI